ncbi:hypothetical protein [Bacteroides sp. 224]|uniref:hypothetical protein n=1 Tax=Bacteroides sp. 224 TaxID=2302936 RepID=UPI0013D37E43|nr:hypothetical protein [Bacteroides sp. 224]NDV65619.1 hypothetical protein [Bacteroides sp. 224]
MSKLTYKVSYYVLYAIFAAIIIVLALFFYGGEMATPIVPEMQNPAYTDALLYLVYGLLGFTVLATVLAFVAQFVAALKDNPVAALKSLLGAILLVLVLVVAWAMGSSEPLEIQGYDGTENRDEFWLKITDMFIYSLYFLIGANIVAMVFSGIKKRFS